MSTTYYEICREYHDRMNKIDAYFEAVFTNYANTVYNITSGNIMNESYDPYLTEAEIEFKLEEVNEQLQEKTEKGTKGIIQAFLDFTQKLFDKIKEFFVGKKIDKLEQQVQQEPELRSIRVEGPDAALIEKIIKERQKIAEDIVKMYQRTGEALTTDEIDDLITQRQVAINKKKMVKKGIILAGTGFATLKSLHKMLGSTNWYKNLMSKIHHTPAPESDGKSKLKAKGVTVASGAVSAYIAKKVADLERENKLLLSGEIKDLTNRLTAATMEKRKK